MFNFVNLSPIWANDFFLWTDPKWKQKNKKQEFKTIKISIFYDERQANGYANDFFK